MSAFAHFSLPRSLILVDVFIIFIIKISSIPSSIGRLTRLEKLILSHNKIDCLPPHIGRLRLLKLFHIINNKISRLPPQVCPLPSLFLLLKYTRRLLYSGVSQLGNCTRLEQLYMEQNPIKYPPFQVFKRPLEEMLLYLAVLPQIAVNEPSWLLTLFL